MKIIERYIEWIVAISVAMITTFTVSLKCVDLFFPFLKPIVSFIRPTLIVLLLIYQAKFFGIRIRAYSWWFFFFLYSFFVYFYLTEGKVYSLTELRAVPDSLFGFFYRTTMIIGYLLSVDTIIHRNNLKKYVFVSFMFGTLPTLWYINIVGIDYIQLYSLKDDKTWIGQLTLAYSNTPLLILAILYYDKLCSKKYISLLLSTIILITVGYIFVISTKRGPLLWTAISILICLYYKSKASFKFFAVFTSIALFLFFYIDIILDSISTIAPVSAERISSTIYGGDLTNRYDIHSLNDSSYYIAIKQFATSPFLGSYFRLITSGYFHGHYPHNIFLEILITMGLLGIIPFILLILRCIKNSHNLFKNSFTTEEMVCLVLFLCIFLQLQTTGSLLLNTWFWLFFYISCFFGMRKKYWRQQIKKRQLR